MANNTIFTNVVPIEIAALMKAKGFDWKGIDDKHSNTFPPTYDMAIDWLLEKGYYVMAVLIRDNKKDNWTYSYNDLSIGEEFIGKKSDKITDRHTALNEGILEILKKL